MCMRACRVQGAPWGCGSRFNAYLLGILLPFAIIAAERIFQEACELLQLCLLRLEGHDRRASRDPALWEQRRSRTRDSLLYNNDGGALWT
jgi:hypothetical protein